MAWIFLQEIPLEQTYLVLPNVIISLPPPFGRDAWQHVLLAIAKLLFNDNTYIKY